MLLDGVGYHCWVLAVAGCRCMLLIVWMLLDVVGMSLDQGEGCGAQPGMAHHCFGV